MRIAITGERGFIARNLARTIAQEGHTFVSLLGGDHLVCSRPTSEPCVYTNGETQWAAALSDLGVDVLVHNAAVVGTDVVALSPADATLSNVLGCQVIARACKAADVPVCYMGTTVIYDTPRYQHCEITESSEVGPHTYYGILKLAGERTIREMARDWMVIRPLFAFGGDGDMNSLIVKGLYAAANSRSGVDMFLDPDKVKDYLYVDDYCRAVVSCCERGLWGQDFNVAAETPHSAREIVQMLSEAAGDDIEGRLVWHPEVDYLGNHRLTAAKVRMATGWTPRHASLRQSITHVWQGIKDVTHNPLSHLDEARSRGVDLLSHY